jgi:RND superfamily putative drug exporter
MSDRQSHNLAARMAHWSGRHRKRAFFGWLAFAILAFAIGNAVGSKPISDVDQFSGESHDAEAALDRAGLRPNSEVVFLQSDELTIEDPEFRAAIADVERRLPRVPYVENVTSPLDGGGSVSDDGHAALVEFEIAGDSVDARDRVDPVLAAVARIQADHPAVDVEQFGSASAN